MNKLQIAEALSKIIKYCESRGCTVNLKSNTYGYYPELNVIRSPIKALNTISQIIGLLHEAGHIHQPKSTFSSVRFSKQRNQAIIIEQEYCAWVKGWQIARELSIDSTTLHSAYIRCWMKWWMSYVRELHAEETLHADLLAGYMHQDFPLAK